MHKLLVSRKWSLLRRASVQADRSNGQADGFLASAEPGWNAGPARLPLYTMLMANKLLLLLSLCAGFAFADNRVFEMRTYICFPGKLETLKTRFRDHTIRIFKKHGMESIGYWV